MILFNFIITFKSTSTYLQSIANRLLYNQLKIPMHKSINKIYPKYSVFVQLHNSQLLFYKFLSLLEKERDLFVCLNYH